MNFGIKDGSSMLIAYIVRACLRVCVALRNYVPPRRRVRRNGNTEFSKSSGVPALLLPLTRLERRKRAAGMKGERQISRQMLKIVHSTNETNIQRARLTKKGSAKERENGGENNWKTIPSSFEKFCSSLCSEFIALSYCSNSIRAKKGKKEEKKKRKRGGQNI